MVPNAGLPQVVDGEARYPLSPPDFAEWLVRFVEEDGVGIVGGCCGTRPDHIRELAKRVGRRRPKPRSSPGDAPTMGKLQAHLGSAGCGTVLFLSGLVSLGLAFALRVRADMQAGMTWSDIFPTGP